MPRLLTALALFAFAAAASAADMKALIIDGQNNHAAWPKTTAMMAAYLEETGLFDVDFARTQYTWKGGDLLAEFPVNGGGHEDLPQPKADPNFTPDFAAYDLVVSNFGYNAASWPEETRQAFTEYVKGGGGVVIVHAADNSFGDWQEYNRIVGLGGWGGRNESTGPLVYVKDGEVVRDDTPGNAGAHGPQHEFAITVRDDSHPVTEGLPREFLHVKDELYQNLRGPAEGMTILATAYADPQYGGTDRHEPMIMVIDYGEGRVFHTPLGHADYSMEGVGFITVFKRGAEWAATGQVTQDVPEDFPGEDEATKRTFEAAAATP